LKHIGLFEGIGGFSLAARWMGWKTIAWCEWNDYCQKILKQHFKEAQGHGDITKTDFTIYRGNCDILTGGFPCQPYSMAGKRKGKEDERHLWPEMLRAIREIQPRWVIGENVHGLINWNRGLVFHEVQAELEAEGYEVWPYVLPACAINAIHRRDRVWFVAYSNKCTTRPPGKSDRAFKNGSKNNDEPKEWREQTEQHIGCSNVLRDDTNTECRRQQERRGQTVSEIGNYYFQSRWPQIEPLLRRGDDGLSNWVDRVKALGNAIVPQMAVQLFRVIALMEVEMLNCQPGDEVKCGVGKNNI
jgi:DNA (cytosine-5)-methyltransferase 1